MSYNLSGQVPMIISVAGDTLFCNGSASTPVSVSPGNLGGSQCSEGTTECGAQQATAQALLSFDSGLTLVQADNAITNNACSYARTLTAATQSVTPLTTQFPLLNGLAAQLKQIAQIIQVRAALGVNRQIFFCGVGNFDTHSNQLVLQNLLLAQISAAMNAFYSATVEMGLAGPDDSGSNGRWVPSTGSVQYAATLASWFGVSPAQMPLVFPNIGSFTTPNLGFV